MLVVKPPRVLEICLRGDCGVSGESLEPTPSKSRRLRLLWDLVRFVRLAMSKSHISSAVAWGEQRTTDPLGWRTETLGMEEGKNMPPSLTEMTSFSMMPSFMTATLTPESH